MLETIIILIIAAFLICAAVYYLQKAVASMPGSPPFASALIYLLAALVFICLLFWVLGGTGALGLHRL